MIESLTGAPANYEELYVHYYRMIVSVMSKAGIPQHELDDAAAWMLVVLMEKDIIGMYDPDKVHSTPNPRVGTATSRTARFSSLLKRVVYLYSLQYRDKVVSGLRQQPHDPLDDGGVLRSERTTLDRDHEEQFLDQVAASSLVDALTTHVHAEHPHLVPTFTVLRDFPHWSRKEMAAHLGVSVGTVGSHVKALRTIASTLDAAHAFRN